MYFQTIILLYGYKYPKSTVIFSLEVVAHWVDVLMSNVCGQECLSIKFLINDIISLEYIWSPGLVNLVYAMDTGAPANDMYAQLNQLTNGTK